MRKTLKQHLADVLSCEIGGSYAALLQKEAHSASGRSLPTLKQIRNVLRRLNAQLEQRIAEIEARDEVDVVLTSEEMRQDAGHQDKLGTTSLSHLKNQQAQVQAMIFRLQRIASVRTHRGNYAVQRIQTNTLNPLVSFTADLDQVIQYAESSSRFLRPEDMQAIGTLKAAVATGNVSTLFQDHTAPAFVH